MKIAAIKTHKITTEDKDIFVVLDKYISNLKDSVIVAVTSKIVSITEGRIVKMEDVDKDKLIREESQYYLPRHENKYNVSLTITNNILVATAGIDESNSNGYYVLWPSNPQNSANKIREYLQKKFNLKNIGLIITDSKTTPLRWGVTAQAIAYSGFMPIKSYIGKKDLFARKFVFETLSIMDSLAAASGLVMGEGAEQTPIAIISDLPFVEFVDRSPTEQELKDLIIRKEDDLYAPLLKNAPWKKGDI